MFRLWSWGRDCVPQWAECVLEGGWGHSSSLHCDSKWWKIKQSINTISYYSISYFVTFYLRDPVPVYDSKVSSSRGDPNIKVLSLIIQEVELNDLKLSFGQNLMVYQKYENMFDLIVPQSEIGSVGAANFDRALWRDGAVVEGCWYINPEHCTLCYWSNLEFWHFVLCVFSFTYCTRNKQYCAIPKYIYIFYYKCPIPKHCAVFLRFPAHVREISTVAGFLGWSI